MEIAGAKENIDPWERMTFALLRIHCPHVTPVWFGPPPHIIYIPLQSLTACQKYFVHTLFILPVQPTKGFYPRITSAKDQSSL